MKIIDARKVFFATELFQLMENSKKLKKNEKMNVFPHPHHANIGKFAFFFKRREQFLSLLRIMDQFLLLLTTNAVGEFSSPYVRIISFAAYNSITV